MSARPMVPFGIEVAADLNTPLCEDDVATLRSLFARHHILVFRGQDLDREQQRRVAGYFGPVFDTAEDTPYISNARDDGALGNADLAFHSDNEYCPEPVTAITLHAIDVEDGKTSTRFADGTAACRRLPDALRARMAGMEALHILGTDLATRNRHAPADPRWPQAVHPVLRAHPVTGEPVLYITEMQTHSVVGVSEAESEELIRDAFEYLYAPEHLLEHFWERGDLVIWDNLALQHARAAIGDAPRTLQRVSIGKSLKAQYPGYAEAFRDMRAGILRKGVASAA